MAADQSALTRYRYMETVQGIPVLGLKEYVVLPLGAFPKTGLRAGRKRSINAVRWALQNNNGKALLLAQKNASTYPSTDDFYDVGVVAELTEPMEVNEEIQFIPIAKSRAVVTRLDDSGDILTADVRVVQEGPIPSSEKSEAEQLSQKLLTAFEYYCLKANRELSSDDQTNLASETEPGRFADRIAFYCYKPKDSRNLHLTYQQLQRVLDALDPRERLQTVYEMTMELLEELLDHGSIEETLRELLVQLSLLQKTLLQLQKTLQDSHLLVQLSLLQKILFLFQKILQDSFPTLKP
ncbi:MAG: LON peptidase substrate-binding domain-containing protein [Candidatus Poribacteria bacterium]|nr:LON peptidase substrate-binding domain-containing protein [Candidatus Poribacteria bacterium]